MRVVLYDEAEVRLIRQVVVASAVVALLTVPLSSFGLGANLQWVPLAHLGLIPVLLVALTWRRVPLTAAVAAGVVLLYAISLTSATTTALAWAAGTGDGAGLGSGFLWALAVVAPATFLTWPVPRASAVNVGAVLVHGAAVVAATWGHPVGTTGVWRVLAAALLVVAVTAATAVAVARRGRRLADAAAARVAASVAAELLATTVARRQELFTAVSRRIREDVTALTAAVRTLERVVATEGDEPASVVVRAALDAVAATAEPLRTRIGASLEAARTEPDGPADAVAVPPLPASIGASASSLRHGGAAAVLAVVATVTVTCGAAVGQGDGRPTSLLVANVLLVTVLTASAAQAVLLPGRRGAVAAGVGVLLVPAVLWLGQREALLASVDAVAPAWRSALVGSAMVVLMGFVLAGRSARTAEQWREVSALTARSDQLASSLSVEQATFGRLVHELQNPLAVVRTSASVLSQRGGELEPEERAELLAGMLRAHRRFVGRVQVAGDVSSSVADGEPVPAAQLLTDALTPVLAEHPGREVRVEVAVDGATVRAGREAVEHVLENLLSNADKYGVPGTPVEVTAALADGAVELRVRNHLAAPLGVEDPASLFAPFARGPDVEVAGVPGSGLGLSVVARVVDAWGGTVGCVPERDAVTFVATMPVV